MLPGESRGDNRERTRRRIGHRYTYVTQPRDSYTVKVRTDDDDIVYRYMYMMFVMLNVLHSIERFEGNGQFRTIVEDRSCD